MDCSLDELLEALRQDCVGTIGDALRKYCRVSAAMVFDSFVARQEASEKNFKKSVYKLRK